MEAPDWVDVFPIKHGDIPASYVIVYQRVDFNTSFWNETSREQKLMPPPYLLGILSRCLLPFGMSCHNCCVVFVSSFLLVLLWESDKNFMHLMTLYSLYRNSTRKPMQIDQLFPGHSNIRWGNCWNTPKHLRQKCPLRPFHCFLLSLLWEFVGLFLEFTVMFF